MGGVDDVVVLFKVKKVKRRPEPTTTATSKATRTMWILLLLADGITAGGDTNTWDDCAMSRVGVFVAECWNKRSPGLLSAETVKGVCLSFADGMNAEGDETMGEGAGWNEKGVKGALVLSSGQEGCSGLLEYALLISGAMLDLISSAGTATLIDSATAMVMAEAVGKRASGSFAMLLSMTSDKAGGIFGLMNSGGLGCSWKCCMRIAMTESPRNGVTPVVIS